MKELRAAILLTSKYRGKITVKEPNDQINLVSSCFMKHIETNNWLLFQKFFVFLHQKNKQQR